MHTLILPPTYFSTPRQRQQHKLFTKINYPRWCLPLKPGEVLAAVVSQPETDRRMVRGAVYAMSLLREATWCGARGRGR